MKKQTIMSYRPTEGYFVTDHHMMPEGALADGSENVLVLAGGQYVFRGVKNAGVGGRSLFRVSGGYASLNDYPASEDESDSDVGSDSEAELMIEGTGSVFNYIANSLFFIGGGRVYRNGTQLTDSVTMRPFTATSNLQLSPSAYTRVFTAGLGEPDAPQVEARTPLPGDSLIGSMTGLYSFKIARVRSLTGGRSIASVTSAVVMCSGQTVRLTFPAASDNGQDRWAIFSTKAGFGGTGVHYLVQEVEESDLATIDEFPRSYELNVVDADLLPVASYIDDYTPPAGNFAGRLENYIVIIGAWDNTVAVSLRNFPESYHPEHLGFLPAEPTAALQDQMGSYIYVSTASSVHALSVIPGSSGNPLIMQTVWADTGVDHNHNWCSVEGVLFAFVSKQGAVTMDPMGRPSNEFALPVAKKMREWVVAETTVLHVPDLNSVAFCNGLDAYLFNYQTGNWSSPARMTSETGSVVSGVVVDRRLKICLADEGTFTLYDFNEQPTDGSTAFKIVSPDKAFARVNLLGCDAVFKAPNAGDFDFKVVSDYNGPERTLTHAATAAGMQSTKQSRWYVPRSEALRVEFSGTQSDFTTDTALVGADLYGTPEESVVI